VNLRILYPVILFLSFAQALAQKAYFQQEVDYVISVALGDSATTLSAFEEVKYKNNSPDRLEFIYFHLWPNAYRDNNTALAKQLLAGGSTRFHYADQNERGYIDGLDFAVDGKKVKWEFHEDNPDICRIFLESPLSPGQSIIISTPFFVRLPIARFSRIGHLNQAAYVTQWYPKPAVYDRHGWHPMPYLDQGEFYSEFGSYDVSITLPSNYVLAATGDLVDSADEERFIESKVAETKAWLEDSTNIGSGKVKDPFIASSATMKTVRLRQDKVHDFAWFADKRFLVLGDEVTLPESGRKVKTWIYFLPSHAGTWRDALQYVNASTLFYSKHVGEYPYRHVTAVDGSIIAGGGMEYPNITVIGESGSALDLDMVITHEVGHNWFYGVLGSNERRYPYLDEGINSFYEMRYLRERYPHERMTRYIQQDSTFRLFRLNRIPYWKMHELVYYLSLRSRTEQPLDLHSADYTPFNYGSVVYSKTPLVLDYMMDYLGEKKFDAAMHAYFEKWKFRHPGPDDFMDAMSESAAENLRPFHDHLIAATDHVDYRIRKIKHSSDGNYTVFVKNAGKAVLPFNVTSTDKNGQVTAVKWYPGIPKKGAIEFPAADAHLLKIDGLDRMPDINRKDNQARVKGMFRKCEPLQLSFITAFEDPARTQVNLVPLAGGNFYNGALTGVAIHNYSFYQKRLEYMFAPMWGWKSRTPTGFAEIDWKAYPKRMFRQLTLGVWAKSFGYDRFVTKFINQEYGTSYDPLLMSYNKISPYIEAELRRKDPNSGFRQTIGYMVNLLFTDSLDLRKGTDFNTTAPAKRNVQSFVNALSYDLWRDRAINPYDLHLRLEHNSSMMKLSLTAHEDVSLGRKAKLYVRLFAGTFLSGTEDERAYYAFRTSGISGYQDYLFSHNFIARNERSGFGFSQFADEEGALKAWTPFGQSRTWLAALNLQSPKIGKLPLRVFADVAVCDGRYLGSEPLLWDAGISLVLIRNIVEVFVPLAYSSDIRNGYTLNNVEWYNRIRFTFNIHKLDPRAMLRSAMN
jgi:hypothetical protein